MKLGMDPRRSVCHYPRIDTKFTLKGSLNFDLLRTQIFKNQQPPSNHMALTYAIYFLIGIGVGTTIFLITGLESQFSKYKTLLTDEIIGGMGNNLYWGWVFFTMLSTALAFIAATLVVNMAPEAVGPGVTELMSYLNGVNNSNWFGLKILLCKITGIILSGVAGLCVGNVGTFAHIGAMIGMGVLYLPIKNIDYYHIDSRKREFVAAGLSCGMAVGFGAPIGGTLFGY
jgi:H+/Cl- antiporter ClcA